MYVNARRSLRSQESEEKLRLYDSQKEIIFFGFDTEDLKGRSSLFHFNCHPVGE